MSDVFEQLLAAKWRGVEFPVTKMRMSIAHDLVEHKYWGVDGARVESTGLAPRRFSFTSPLLNGISPGRAEKWAALYPNQFRLLLTAFQKKERGEMQHPEFGIIICKAERFDADWDAARRGGTDVEMSFVETLTEADLEVQEDTPVGVVDIGEIDELDSPTLKADLKTILLLNGLPLPPYLVKETISLGGLANKIKAVTDYPSVVSRRAAGAAAELKYHVDRIAQSAQASRSALTWPVVQSTERVKASLHEAEQNLLRGARRVKFFRVPSPTTLAGVARQIPGATVSDLIKLNPTLVRRPELPENTIVRYFATAA